MTHTGRWLEMSLKRGEGSQGNDAMTDHRLTRRRDILGRLMAAMFAGPVLLAAGGQTSAEAIKLSATVRTTSGRIRGMTSRGVHVFKGVPYAAPTSGPNRFMPPARRKPWGDVREALRYGLSSPQSNPPPPDVRDPRSLIPQFAGLEAFPEGEDCLVLNVWTRGLSDRGRRPVMLWLHPGGYEYGSGSSPGFDGTNLCLRGDVVVVTINHRLNVMGFTHLGDLAGSEFATSGNVGMLDIVAALDWVRENIEQFGGDPNTVTVFGQSGGARKVSVLQAMPAAAGLFQRAIIQSGPGIRMLDRDAANKATELLLTELGINRSNARQLQNVPVETLLRAYRKVCRIQPGSFLVPTPSFGPFVDGAVLPRHPFDPVAPEISADVPLLIGSNRTELSLWRMLDPSFKADEATLHDSIAQLVGTDAEIVVKAYHDHYPSAGPLELAVCIETDLYYGVPTQVLAARKAALGRAPAYVYRFDWSTPVLGGKLLSPHALDIPFAFDNIQIARQFTGGTADAQRLAEKVSDAWTAFARSGSPAISQLPDWPRYDSTSRSSMLLKDESELAHDPGAPTRTVIQSVLKLG
jgi:para-nitrobenzyl esterase